MSERKVKKEEIYQAILHIWRNKSQTEEDSQGLNASQVMNSSQYSQSYLAENVDRTPQVLTFRDTQEKFFWPSMRRNLFGEEILIGSEAIPLYRQAVPTHERDCVAFDSLVRYHSVLAGLDYVSRLPSRNVYLSTAMLNRVLTHGIFKATSLSCVQKAVNVLSHAVSKHPPRDASMRDHYIGALRLHLDSEDKPFEFLRLLLAGCFGERQIFQLMEQSSSDEPPRKKSRRNEKKTILSKNGNVFEMETSTIAFPDEDGSSVEEMSEKEKCFELLRFLVNLLSTDFSFWSQRPRNPLFDLRSSKSSPMVARIFWPHGTCSGSANSNCKTLFQFFAKALAEKEMALADETANLVAMAGEVSFLSNLESSMMVTIPKENARGYASALEIALQDLLNTEEDVQFCLSYIRPSWLLMEVADRCLMRIDPGVWKRHMKLNELVKLPYFEDKKPQKDVQTERGKPSRRHKRKEIQEIVPVPLMKVENPLAIVGGKHGKNSKGETKLHIACQKDDSAKVRELLRMPGVDVNARDNVGWAPIHEAAARGAAESLRLLLNHKVDTLKSFFISSKVDQKDGIVDVAATGPSRRTALHIAVEYGRADIVRMLLKYAGDTLLSIENEEGFTAEQLCKDAPLREIFQQYRERSGLSLSQSDSLPQSYGIFSSPKRIKPSEIRGETSSVNACLWFYIGAYVSHFKLDSVWAAICSDAGKDEERLNEVQYLFSDDFGIVEYYREMTVVVNKFLAQNN